MHPLVSRVVLIAFGYLTSLPLGAADMAPFPDDPYQGDPREMALVPRYCIYTQLLRDRVPGGNNLDEVSRWTSIMGPTFNDMHHYCIGLMRVNRAQLFLVGNRRFNLESSVGEYDYVLNRAPANFILRPEILTKKGESLLLLDRPTEGAAALLRAIELKPDFWPPYAVLSDYFKKANNIAIARQWLEKGLAADPNARALRQRLDELGGTSSK